MGPQQEQQFATAAVVPARQMTQCGCTILVGRCPHCNTEAGLTGEGLHLCRTCFRMLRYKFSGEVVK